MVLQNKIGLYIPVSTMSVSGFLVRQGHRLTNSGTFRRFCATMGASLVANGLSIPIDVLKSRLQNMPIPKAGEVWEGHSSGFV